MVFFFGIKTGSATTRSVVAALIGILVGVSPAMQGLFAERTWGAAGLFVLAACLAAAVASDRRPGWLALLALAGLSGLWLWSELSSSWGESGEQALIQSNRWLLDAALLAAAYLLVAGERRPAKALMGGCWLAVLGVATWMAGRMLAADGSALFLATRLGDPVGYINGQGTYLLMAVWPLLALAENVRRPLRAGAALGGGVVLLSLLFLTQSRGATLALVLTLIVVVVAVPRRPGRLWAALALGVAMALLVGPLRTALSDVQAASGQPQDGGLRHAFTIVLAVAGGGAVLWAALGFAVLALRRRSDGAPRALARVSAVGLVVLAVGTVGLGVALAGRIGHAADTQYHAFVRLKGSSGTSRLLSGAGNRYDYWRVAWNEFQSARLIGVGAGDYGPGYFAERRTSEDIRQPHSIELETLAGLGVVGGVLLLAFLGAMAVAIVRAGRRVRTRTSGQVLVVGATGTFVSFMVHTSVDWMHRIPGLIGIALCAAATLLVRAEPGRSRNAGGEAAAGAQPMTRQRGGRRRWAGLVLVAVLVAFAGVQMARMTLVARDRGEAQGQLANAPLAALRSTSRALALEGDSVTTLYVRAAAFARLDCYRDAKASLQRAIALEPHNWLTWVLLGDLYVRGGDRAAARRAYRRGQQLNPRERGITQALAAVPAGG